MGDLVYSELCRNAIEYLGDKVEHVRNRTSSYSGNLNDASLQLRVRSGRVHDVELYDLDYECYMNCVLYVLLWQMCCSV